MTTLAYRDGVLAADTRGTRCGYILPGHLKKIGKTKVGCLVGIAGVISKAMPCFQALMDGADAVEAPKEDCTIMMITPKGKVVIFEEGAAHKVHKAPFFAIGSGMAVALGAMHAGASAVEAVRIATLVDNDSGGKVESVRL